MTMISEFGIAIRPVMPKDRQGLANLIHFETHVHRHLDWKPPLDWLGDAPFLVLEQDGILRSALICPPDPPDVAWMRLFAVSSLYPLEKAWDLLWGEARKHLLQNPRIQIASIPLQEWFRRLLDQSHFRHTRDIVLMVWHRGSQVSMPKNPTVLVRPMNSDDLPTIEILDGLAFEPIWQNSLDSLQHAFHQASVATVALVENSLVGYQISTASPMGGHLARLAVHPHYQCKGIGSALVGDMLDQFSRRGASRVTVNTQDHNVISKTLYQKLGFRQSNEIYPVYQYIKEMDEPK